MNLIWFLTIGVLTSFLFGEFGRFPFATSNAISLADIVSAATLAFLTIWTIGIKKQLQFSKYFWLVGSFWIAAVVSLVVSANLIGGLYLARFILYTGIFWLGYQLIKSKVINLSQLLNSILLFGGIFSLLGFIQVVIFPDLTALSYFGYDPHQGRLVSTFLDPNFAGSLINIFLALTTYLWFVTKNKRYLAFGAFFLIGLVLTFSRSGYLMFMIQVVGWSLLISRKALLGLVICLMVLLLIPRVSDRIIGGLTLDKSASERLVSWQDGWLAFQSNPITGVGFNNLRSYLNNHQLNKVYSEDGGHAGGGVDSSLMFVLATSGILGLITYLSFWVYLIYQFWSLGKLRIIIYGLLLAMLINSQFINSLFYPPIMLILYLSLGGLIADRD